MKTHLLLLMLIQPLMFTLPAKAEFANVNGIKMYYEIHGDAEGIPLILIHGGGSTIDSSFGRLIPLLKDNRKLIAIEEQAHGRTNDRPTPVRFETTAEDIITLMKQLKIEKFDILGFSNGASTAMHLTIRHPEKVRKLIFASSISKKSGAIPGFWDQFKKSDFSMMPQDLKDAFLKVTPDETKLMVMFNKDSERMKNFKDIPDKDVKSIKADTLIIQGAQDVGTPEHAVSLSRMISKSQLVILPGGHGEYLGEIMRPDKTSRMHEATAIILNEFLAKTAAPERPEK